MPRSRVVLAGGGTGGHLYPALNLADAFGRLAPEVECVLVGAERGLESRVLPETGHAFRLLPLQPIYRHRPWRNWRLAASAPGVVAGVRRLFSDFEPRLVVGTGGYVAGPPLAAARLRGLPTAIQEQNAWPGLVTRLLAPRVDQIHLAYPEAESRLRIAPGTRVFAYGNPVALPPVEGADEERKPSFDWPGGRTLLVFGGSQGALGLNRAFLRDLEWAAGGSAAETSSGPRARRGPGALSAAASAPAPAAASTWPHGVSIVWIAGREHASEIATRVSSLPWADRIRVVPYIDDLGRQLDHVTLALCRAGAMSVAELCAAGRPAILIPLPTSAGGHQLGNARALTEAGAAEMREEGDLAAGELWSLCRELLGDEGRLASMSAAARARGRPDAALAVVGELLDLIGRGDA